MGICNPILFQISLFAQAYCNKTTIEKKAEFLSGQDGSNIHYLVDLKVTKLNVCN